MILAFPDSIVVKRLTFFTKPILLRATLYVNKSEKHYYYQYLLQNYAKMT